MKNAAQAVSTLKSATQWVFDREDELLDAGVDDISAAIFSEYCELRGLDAAEVEVDLGCNDPHALVGYDYCEELIGDDGEAL